jgi:ADP-heptose:LPS heptosyltransferase
MKILVISLLRLGDFIQAAPVIGGLKQKYPGSRIDVLVHSPVAKLKPLMGVVHQWHVIDREELQAGLGEAGIPLLTSFHVLKEQCDALAEERYDLIVNLTHTEFSGWIAGYLPSRDKIGLAFSPSGRPQFHSPWFHYLNQRADGQMGDILNYTDIFIEACQIDRLSMNWALTATKAGELEADAVELAGDDNIVVQALTSDSKKNWGTARWTEFLNHFCAFRPSAKIILLGAPSEMEKLAEIRDSCSQRERVSIAILSLDGALALLNRASLLISGDTSIKHLANAAKCRVMEISLGSSDLKRTGIYKPGSLIVTSKAACAPCPHSSPCSQASHICAQSLNAEATAKAADLFLAGRPSELATLTSSMDIKITRILGTGFWFAESVGGVDPMDSMEVWLERSVQKFLFNGTEKALIPTFGSEGYQLSEELARLIPDGRFSPLVSRLDFLEQKVTAQGRRCEVERDRFQPGSGEKVIDLAQLRSVQNRLEDERREVEVKSKLIRSLRTRLAEVL